MAVDPALHATELFLSTCSATEHDLVWAFLPFGPFESFESFHSWFSSLKQSPKSAHFCIVENGTNKPVGMASLVDFDATHRTVEISNFFLCRRAQKAGASYEAAMLLLKFAFDLLECRRVQCRVNDRNEKAKHSALKIGFTFEGLWKAEQILHKRDASGRTQSFVQDTAYYSVIDAEWPSVMEKLEERIAVHIY